MIEADLLGQHLGDGLLDRLRQAVQLGGDAEIGKQVRETGLLGRRALRRGCDRERLLRGQLNRGRRNR